MGVGKSGRIVIEIEPGLKQDLYSALSEDNKSLKAWFLENAEAYLRHKGQLSLDYDPAAKTADTSRKD
jgi:hypothetical protein